MNKRRKRGRWKLWVGVAVVMLVVAGAVGSKFAAGKKVPDIETVKVARGTVVEKLAETGNIELLRTVEVKSKIAGTVRRIMVREGETVHEGQPLCVIDPDPTQTLLLFQKRSAVDRSRIALQQTERELQRRRELAKTSMVSDKEVEDADNDWSNARNAYTLAVQELEIMEREIETAGSGTEERIVSSTVRAPYAGYVTKRFVEEGALVTSGISSVVAGTTLFQIGDPSTMIIKTGISEVDIGKVSTGDEVRIKLDAYPDTTFAGVIRHISPVGERQEGRNVIAFATEVEIVDTDPRLRPGMSCDVDVIITRAEDVLNLPVESVYEKKDDNTKEDNGVGQDENNVKPAEKVVFIRTTDPVKNGGSKLSFFTKKHDPFADFTETHVETGIRSENRIVIAAAFDTSKVVAARDTSMVVAVFDTSTVVAADGAAFFEARENAKKKGKDAKSDPAKNGGK